MNYYRYEIWTISHKIWNIRYKIWSNRYKMWTIRYKMLTIRCKIWTIRYKIWTIRYKIWTIRYKIWTIVGIKYEVLGIWNSEYKVWTRGGQKWISARPYPAGFEISGRVAKGRAGLTKRYCAGFCPPVSPYPPGFPIPADISNPAAYGRAEILFCPHLVWTNTYKIWTII